eukprot:1990723-Prymnesium_polylepis.2
MGATPFQGRFCTVRTQQGNEISRSYHGRLATHSGRHACARARSRCSTRLSVCRSKPDLVVMKQLQHCFAWGRVDPAVILQLESWDVHQPMPQNEVEVRIGSLPV